MSIEMQLKELEYKLKDAHAKFLKEKDIDIKSESYKQAKDEYLLLAEEYRKLFYKYTSHPLFKNSLK